MNCEMCGTEADLFKTNIEGTFMNVCQQCSKYGKVVESLRKEPARQKKKVFVEVKAKKEILEVIVPDYAELIRKAREKLSMKQEEFAKKVNEKESQIHKMETGAMTPSLKTAKKLEKMLNIRLTEEYVERENPVVKGKESVMTLGDLVKIKKKP
jgi:putative transcription factor